MKQYNFSEMQQMQEQALERVREMQTRAKYAAQDAEKSFSADDSAKSSDYYKDNFYNTVKAMPKTGHIKMPVELPDKVKPYESFKEYFEPENQRQSEKKQQVTKANLLDNVLQDPDQALLFALLLLLQSDDVDEELMMSLLYIML